MRGIVFHPTVNEKGKRDADEFRREAEAFARLHGFDVVGIDNGQPLLRRRLDVAAALRQGSVHSPEPSLYDVVAFCCHGWKDGLQLLGRKDEVNEAAAAIVDHCTPAVIVPLYACSTGRDDDRDHEDDLDAGPGGDGGYADELRDALCRAHATHCRVDAHATLGHTTRNPFVRRMEGGGSLTGGQGGGWLIRPWGPLWSAWRTSLRTTDLRLRFPLMEPREIHGELRRLAAA